MHGGGRGSGSSFGDQDVGVAIGGTGVPRLLAVQEDGAGEHDELRGAERQGRQREESAVSQTQDQAVSSRSM